MTKAQERILSEMKGKDLLLMFNTENRSVVLKPLKGDMLRYIPYKTFSQMLPHLEVKFSSDDGTIRFFNYKDSDDLIIPKLGVGWEPSEEETCIECGGGLESLLNGSEYFERCPNCGWESYCNTGDFDGE